MKSNLIFDIHFKHLGHENVLLPVLLIDKKICPLTLLPVNLYISFSSTGVYACCLVVF